MPTSPDPIVFLPDGSSVPCPIDAVVVDDVIIPASMVLADGFVIDKGGRVTMTLKASSHVTLRYSDEDGPTEARVEVNGL